MIAPWSPDQLNPASYDVLLGPQILVENRVETNDGNWHRTWLPVDIQDRQHDLLPGDFVLASTLETICLPQDIEATFCLKSSRGREGYDHALAGFCDPGFYGQVTLEIKNCSNYQTLPLRAGMRIGQLRFSRLAGIPVRGYDVTGRYNHQKGPTASLAET